MKSYRACKSIKAVYQARLISYQSLMKVRVYFRHLVSVKDLTLDLVKLNLASG